MFPFGVNGQPRSARGTFAHRMDCLWSREGSLGRNRPELGEAADDSGGGAVVDRCHSVIVNVRMRTVFLLAVGALLAAHSDAQVSMGNLNSGSNNAYHRGSNTNTASNLLQNNNVVADAAFAKGNQIISAGSDASILPGGAAFGGSNKDFKSTFSNGNSNINAIRSANQGLTGSEAVDEIGTNNANLNSASAISPGTATGSLDKSASFQKHHSSVGSRNLHQDLDSFDFQQDGLDRGAAAASSSNSAAINPLGASAGQFNNQFATTRDRANVISKDTAVDNHFNGNANHAATHDHVGTSNLNSNQAVSPLAAQGQTASDTSGTQRSSLTNNEVTDQSSHVMANGPVTDLQSNWMKGSNFGTSQLEGPNAAGSRGAAFTSGFDNQSTTGGRVTDAQMKTTHSATQNDDRHATNALNSHVNIGSV